MSTLNFVFYIMPDYDCGIFTRINCNLFGHLFLNIEDHCSRHLFGLTSVGFVMQTILIFDRVPVQVV